MRLKKMPVTMAKLMLAALFLTATLLIRNPSPSGWNRENASVLNSIAADRVDVEPVDRGSRFRFQEMKASEVPSGLRYNYYSDTCPNAEIIVRSTVREILNESKETTAALLRLFFHDCFIQVPSLSLFFISWTSLVTFVLLKLIVVHMIWHLDFI